MQLGVLSGALQSMRKAYFLPLLVLFTSICRLGLTLSFRNGRTAGITLPSSGAQERVIRKALEKGDIHPNEITYVECHGTGTKVGDAIEVDALSSVFQRASHHPLYIGSVKSNIGHSEAASAISSVIKGVMAMERGQIPGTHGLRHINPTLRAEERHISIPKTLIPWPQSHNEVRRMGKNKHHQYVV